MSTSSRDNLVRATDLRFVRTEGRVFLRLLLDDGRRHDSPIEFYPTLQQASSIARHRWEWIGRGIGIHWPELDFDLSVEGIILGCRERQPVTGPASAGARPSNSRLKPSASRLRATQPARKPAGPSR